MAIITRSELTLTDIKETVVSNTAPLNPSLGDVWYKQNGKYVEQYRWNGVQWEFISSTKETEDIKNQLIVADGKINAAQEKADESLGKAQEGFDKAEALSEKVDVNTGAISSVKQTTAGLQTAVKSKADSSTVTQLAEVVASKVSNADFDSNKTQTAELISSTVSLQNNENVRYVRFSGSGNSVNSGNHLLELQVNDSDNKNVALNILPTAEKGAWTNLVYVTDGVSDDNAKYATANGDVSFIIDLKKIYQTLSSLKLWIYVATGRDYLDVKLEISTDKKTWKIVYLKDNYTPTTKGDTVILSNAEASSQISQLADNINLKVDKNGIINQINISTEGIVIAGENVWISGKTKIDNAVIKNAMIDSLSANKLTAGTIDAGKINVVNLNASNISAGIITGANLAINLNSGEVTFQKGIIKRADELFSIDVTKGIVESYDSNGGFTISKGEITLNSSPELTIGNSKKYGTITYKWRLLDASGLALIGEDGYSLGTSNAVKNIANSTVNQGSAISGNKEGYLNVFSRQVINLSSGDLYSYGSLNYKSLASIEIGNTSRNKSEVAISANTVRLSAKDGDHILLSSDSTSAFVQSNVIYRRTYSSAPNLYITDLGTIGRSTSASKYKLAIEEDKTDNYKNILKLKHKTWYDKANTETYARALDNKDTFDWDNPEDEVLPVERIHGLIAEDLVEAGLTEFVSYGELNDDGTKEVEGIQYDRLVVPLLQIVKDHQIEIEKLKERII
ncbi:hypothetical protein CNY62_02410 [Brochothrix thermosphacta]|uniref:Peptidase S74 domain-containing protein n=1 Tax=Brochothrix thermosphacta TaxID=2756 RepID=A0A291BVT7_BROTH|nr:gp58-like family protein [Brochothrix thermosphacta]ATF25337.1 hypothetical protein CNY62_02410 [Brochothrix thermosphacta]